MTFAAFRTPRITFLGLPVKKLMPTASNAARAAGPVDRLRYVQGKLARPAVTTVAPGSARLIGRVAAFRSSVYPFDQIAPPSMYQYFTRWGSFQICQRRIGSLGSSGCSAQKLPFGPYRPTSAVRYAA